MHHLGQFCSLGFSGGSLSCLEHSRLLVSWVDSSNSDEFRNKRGEWSNYEERHFYDFQDIERVPDKASFIEQIRLICS